MPNPPEKAEGRPGIVLVDCFGGISASRVATVAAGVRVASHHYIEIHEPAIKITRQWFKDLKQRGDIRALAMDSTKFAEDIWKEARSLDVSAVLFSAGFPCREVSSVNQDRRGLQSGETARFQEAKMLFRALHDTMRSTDVPLHCVWECVQSMTLDTCQAVTKELREIDVNIEVVGIDTAGIQWCRRARYWWTSFHVPKLPDEHEERRHGIRHVHLTGVLEPLEDILEGGYLPKWHGHELRRFHTFTRCRPSSKEPAKPTGLATATLEARARWAQDDYRYSPYQYEADLLVWRGDQWRNLSANERARMLGFPDGYLCGVSEDEGCSLAGDVFSTAVFGRLLHAVGLGGWPLAKTTIENNQIVKTTTTTTEEKPRDGEPNSTTDFRPSAPDIEVMDRVPIKSTLLGKVRTAILNGTTDRGPYGLIKTENEWQCKGYATLRKVLPSLWDLPLIGDERYDGFDLVMNEKNVTTHVVLLPEETIEIAIISLTTQGGLALQVGESAVALGGHVTKAKTKSKEITLKIFGQEAVAMYFYKLGPRKPKAVLEEARRAGLWAYQPEETPLTTRTGQTGAPTEIRTDLFDIIDLERWRLRSAQDEDEDAKHFIKLLEVGERELRKTTDRKTAELTLRHQDEYRMENGLLCKWVHPPGDANRLVVFVPNAGNRAVVINGKRHVLTWRGWILHHSHNSTTGGHVGADAMESRVQTIGWWPTLRKDCEEWVMKCVICKSIKGQAIGGATWRSERYTAPFRVLQIDLITDLVPESHGCSHVLTAIDVFTLWLWLIPIEDKSAITVSRALLHHVYMDLGGFPTILRSDNGKEFTADLTREMNRLMGTTQIFGSAYHPRSQGLIEGSHKPVEEVLQAFISETGEDWTLHLPTARWAWNTTPKRSLAGMTPYQAVTGLVPRNPLTSYLNQTNDDQVTPSQYVQELMEAMEKIHADIIKAQERRAEEAEARGEAGRIPRRLEVGEHVLLKTPIINNKSRKLQPRAKTYVYKIIKTVGDGDTYVLGDPATGQEDRRIIQPVHADRLIPLLITDLTTPIEEKNWITLEGLYEGRIHSQSVDGRVLVKLTNRKLEDKFTNDYRHLGVVRNTDGNGVWVDLTRLDYVID